MSWQPRIPERPTASLELRTSSCRLRNAQRQNNETDWTWSAVEKGRHPCHRAISSRDFNSVSTFVTGVTGSTTASTYCDEALAAVQLIRLYRSGLPANPRFRRLLDRKFLL